MSSSDRLRLDVLHRLHRGELTQQDASQLLQRSERQIRRLLVAFRERGDVVVCHQNRGRAPHNRLSDAERAIILAALRDMPDYNDHHLRDRLEEQGLAVSSATVRRLRLSIGKPAAQKRRPKRHCKRPRKPQAGMLVQIDGSPFPWLGSEHPECCLIVGIDDATGQVFAVLREVEDCLGYLLLIHCIATNAGTPWAVYADRHTIFTSPSKHDENGRDNACNSSTQFGQAMERLGTRIISANSPQAKGRVERVHRTLQDRLAKELRDNGIASIDEANGFLPRFLASFNKKFMVEPRNPVPAWRKPQSPKWLKNQLAIEFRRTVRRDNTINLAGASLAIPQNDGLDLTDKRIGVRLHLDRSMSYWLGDRRIGTGPTLTGEPTPDTNKLKAILVSSAPTTPKRKPPIIARTKRPSSAVKPAEDHPWKRFVINPRKPTVVPSRRAGGG